MHREVFLDNTPGRGSPLSVTPGHARIVTDSWLVGSNISTSAPVLSIVIVLGTGLNSTIIRITYTKYINNRQESHLYIEITVNKFTGELLDNFTTARSLTQILSTLNQESIFSISKEIYSIEDPGHIEDYISRIRRLRPASV